jgi:hypothetical protein
VFRQLAGVQRFELLQPCAHRAHDFHPSFSGADRQSRIGSEHLRDESETVDLRPGEVLFLPAFTLHQVSTPPDVALGVGLSRSWESAVGALQRQILRAALPFELPGLASSFGAGDLVAVHLSQLIARVVASADGALGEDWLIGLLLRRITDETVKHAPVPSPPMCQPYSEAAAAWRVAEGANMSGRITQLVALFEQLAEKSDTSRSHCDVHASAVANESYCAVAAPGAAAAATAAEGCADWAVAELVLAALVETESLWAAGESGAPGLDAEVCAAFVRDCLLDWYPKWWMNEWNEWMDEWMNENR